MRTKMRAHQAATGTGNPAIIFASRSAADHGVVRLRAPPRDDPPWGLLVYADTLAWNFEVRVRSFVLRVNIGYGEVTHKHGRLVKCPRKKSGFNGQFY